MLRDRAERRRVRDEKKGSEGETRDDGPADAGSSKSNVRGFGAGGRLNVSGWSAKGLKFKKKKRLTTTGNRRCDS